eukprot:TRINITY_DN39488_c0_g1_i1.p1 TRINITY_DN39488_c0_g1~~TRINITY_DN39488_c0_g1_i1.p1  ORF type:complete len:356 (-),score=79.22 TRINITY_DN39488_c0_g1_i1:135-1055(-)
MFAVFMTKDLHAEGSHITFGGMSPSVVTSEMNWVPLSDPGYWQFSMSDVHIGGKALNWCSSVKLSSAIAANASVFTFFGKMCCRTVEEFEKEDRCQYHEKHEGWRSQTMTSAKVLSLYADGRVAVIQDDGCVQKVPQRWLSLPDGCRGDGSIQAVLDTGSSLMMAPKQLVERISAEIGVKEKCTEQLKEKMPSILFQLPGGKSLTLTPDDYMDTVQDGEDTYCWLHLMPAPDVAKGPLFVLGMPFLRAYYTVFDAEQRKVGFASPLQHLAATATDQPSAHVQSGTVSSGEEAMKVARVTLRGHRPE